jgi:NAD(P)-dependent dehydrogenase (short-subunit alcohol dehydrogenase family)
MSEERPVAVVTGAARGIGAGIARRLAADGYKVALLDLEAPRALAEALNGVALACDVADPASTRAAAEATGPAQVLVNNAGVWFTKSLLDSTDADLATTVAVNLLGVVHCCRAFAPAMIKRGSGSIVNVSSGAARAAPTEYGVYPSTKAGVEALTRQLAMDWGPAGIRVNAVAPGAIQTERNVANFTGERLTARTARIPLRRTGLPADIADVISVLCSEDMRYVTGQIVAVDGGLCANQPG